MIDPDRLKPFLRHEDTHIRRAVVDYFTEGWSRDPAILPLLLSAVDGLPPRPARLMLRDADHLVVTAEGFDRLLDALGRWQDEGVVGHLAEAALAAPIDLLKARHEELVGHRNFPETLAPRVRRRLMYDDWPGDRLWGELQKFSKKASGHSSSDLDMTLADDLTAALARIGTPDDAAVLARLDDPDVKWEWLEIFLVDLLGARGVRPAIPKLVEYLGSEDDYLPESATEALVRIGDPEALRLAQAAFVDRGDDLRYAATALFGDLKHPDAERTILEILEVEEDETFRTMLAMGLCEQFSERAVEVVLKEVERGYDTSYTTLEHELLPVLDVLGIELTQTPEWREERRAQDEHMNKMLDEWEAELDEDTPRSRDRAEAAEIDDGTGVTLPIVRDDARVGRNDPCPCGSGKKFKKCCGWN